MLSDGRTSIRSHFRLAPFWDNAQPAPVDDRCCHNSNPGSLMMIGMKVVALFLGALLCTTNLGFARPNFVFILSDDMGYSDLGCYGGEIRTPNLDALAKDGLRFRNFYNNPMCCPTRASFLSGLYPHQAGMGAMTSNRGTPAYRGQLGERCVTMAQVLKSAGYQTYLSGKWHLTQIDDRSNWPCQRGFDHFYGILGGAASFYAPAYLKRNNDDASADFKNNPDYYFTDAISDTAVDYIERAARSDQPFFLYVSYTAAHWPLHARDEDIARYKGRYSAGWDALRQERYQRMKKLGVIDDSIPLSPRDPSTPSWEKAGDKEWQQRRMEVYAAQVTVMDEGIGRIVKALKETGEFDDTLTCFFIDNGACHVEYGPKRAGYYLPTKTRSGGTMIPGNLPKVMPGPENTYQSYGKEWANAGNTPFRFYKSYAHEGGVRTPLIVHWPERIPGNAWTNTVGHVIDLLPTALELSGATYPREHGGETLWPLEGSSLTTVFKNPAAKSSPRTIFWEHGGKRAVRDGDWKAVALGNKKPWELYNLKNDPSELRDLAASEKERLTQLTAKYQAWSKKVGVEKKRK